MPDETGRPSILRKVLNAQAFRVFRHRNFRWFWVSSIGQTAGQGMQQLSVAWLVLELTDSTSQLGIVIFIQGVPMMVFMIYGGVLADRIERIRLLIMSQLLTIPVLAALGIMASSGHAQVWQVYFAALFIGGIQAISWPARNAAIRDLVDREEVVNAVALNATVQNLTQIIGPSVAGFVIGWLGIAPTLYLNASLYVIGATALLMIRDIAPVPQVAKSGVAHDVIDGARHVYNVPPVFAIITIGCVMGFLIHPVSQLMPAFAREELKVGPEGAGALLMFAGIGSVVGNVSIATFGSINVRQWLLLWAAFVYGLSLFLFAFVPSYALALVLMLFVGGGRMVFVSLGTAFIQLLVAQNFAGRALSLWSLGVALMFIGALPLGIFGDVIGLRAAIAVNSVLYLIVLGAVGFAWSPIRKIETRPSIVPA